MNFLILQSKSNALHEDAVQKLQMRLNHCIVSERLIQNYFTISLKCNSTRPKTLTEKLAQNVYKMMVPFSDMLVKILSKWYHSEQVFLKCLFLCTVNRDMNIYCLIVFTFQTNQAFIGFHTD